MTMHVCTCGRSFPGTLAGAWDARLHADAEGHALALVPERPLPVRAAA